MAALNRAQMYASYGLCAPARVLSLAEQRSNLIDQVADRLVTLAQAVADARDGLELHCGAEANERLSAAVLLFDQLLHVRDPLPGLEEVVTGLGIARCMLERRRISPVQRRLCAPAIDRFIAFAEGLA